MLHGNWITGANSALVCTQKMCMATNNSWHSCERKWEEAKACLKSGGFAGDTTKSAVRML